MNRVLSCWRARVCVSSECTARFTAKSSMYVHLRKHAHGDVGQKIVYFCPIDDCDKRYTSKNALRTHLAKHVQRQYQNSLGERTWYITTLTGSPGCNPGPTLNHVVQGQIANTRTHSVRGHDTSQPWPGALTVTLTQPLIPSSSAKQPVPELARWGDTTHHTTLTWSPDCNPDPTLNHVVQRQTASTRTRSVKWRNRYIVSIDNRSFNIIHNQALGRLLKPTDDRL